VEVKTRNKSLFLALLPLEKKKIVGVGIGGGFFSEIFEVN